MRKVLIGNIERVLQILMFIAIVYALVTAVMAGRDQLINSDDGYYGIVSFIVSFISTFIINISLSVSGIVALYLLVDIRTLLIQKR